MSAAEGITRQFSGVIPGMSTGQNAVSKTWVEEELAELDGDISNVSSAIAVAQDTANYGVSAAGTAQSTANTAIGIASSAKNSADIAQNRINNLLVHNGDGTKDTEIIDARKPVEGIEFPVLGARLNNVDAQLAETAEHLAGVGLNILNYRLPSDPDSTLMFERAFAVSKNWSLPAATFTVSESWLIKSGTVLKGIPGKTKIKFTKVNDVFLKGYDYHFAGTDFGGCVFEDIEFHGMGKGYGQTGGFLQSYMGRIRGCKFFDFERALKVSGVIFDIEKNEFWNNGKSISIQDNYLDGEANFNTLLNFDGNRFYFNDLGMCNIGDGQTFRSGHENVINFKATWNVFEANGKAHALWVFSGILNDNWYEKNTNRPTVCMNNITTFNNRFEVNANDQNLLPIATDPAYTGTVDIPSTGGGLINFKRFRLQRYNSTGADISTRTRYELEMNGKFVDNINDSSTTISRAVTEMNYTRASGNASDIWNKTSFLIIKETGAIIANAIDPAFTGLSVSKLGVGRYKITLRDTGVINGVVSLSVVSSDSEGHDSNTNMYHGKYRLRNTFGNSDYTTYNTFNVIYVDTYNKTANADTLADARIHLIIHHG